MMNFKKFFIIILAVVTAFLCVSCDSDVTVELKKDGSVGLKFSGEFGDGLEKLVGSISEDDVIFDTKTITYELSKSGFSDVVVTARGKKSLLLTMTEKNQNSYLFTSGILKTAKNKISLNFTPDSLVKFYSLCDEQIVLYLDLLLAPIFNDEKMSESEYLETIGAFYGQSVADEFAKSNVRLTIINPDGQTKKSVVSIAKLLTLKESLLIE